MSHRKGATKDPVEPSSEAYKGKGRRVAPTVTGPIRRSLRNQTKPSTEASGDSVSEQQGPLPDPQNHVSVAKSTSSSSSAGDRTAKNKAVQAKTRSPTSNKAGLSIVPEAHSDNLDPTSLHSEPPVPTSRDQNRPPKQTSGKSSHTNQSLPQIKEEKTYTPKHNISNSKKAIPIDLDSEDSEDWNVPEQRDRDFMLVDAGRLESDNDREDEISSESDADSEVTIPTSAPRVAPTTGRKPGRPPKAPKPAPKVPLTFMTKVNSVVRRFTLDSTSALQDVRDEVAGFVQKRHSQLKLFYTRIWSGKSDKVELKDTSDWDMLIKFAISNINKKKASLYQIEIFDGIEGKDTKKSQKSKKVVEDDDGEDGVPKLRRTHVMGRIQNKHFCYTDGWECYVVPDRSYEPAVLMNSHHRIPREVIIMWTNDIMAKKEDVSEDFLPLRLVPLVLGIDKPLGKEEPFQAVKPKARSMSGPSPMQPGQSTQSTQPTEATQPAHSSQPPFSMPMQPNMWPPYMPFYPPPALPSPYKQLFMGPMSAERLSSPTRRNDTKVNEGARLDTWLSELDEQLDSDDEPYTPLLNSLNEIGARHVNDLTLFDANEIQKHTGCSIGMAKRLIAKAKSTLNKS